MVLDSENQRGLLLQLINAAPIEGNYSQAKHTVNLLDDLVKSINNANIKDMLEQSQLE